MTKANILIADSHKIVRDGIIAMLESNKEFTVAEAGTEKKILEICQSREINLIILDVNMPEMNGIELIRKLKKKNPEIKILALTSSFEKQQIRLMVQEGASGYLLKNSGRKELLEAIHTILDGSFYFSNEVTLSVMQNLNRPGAQKGDPHSLTGRELEILGYIVREYTNPEIAEKLSISVRTVDAHRRNLLQKTGARNTAGLVRYALKNKLVE